MYWINLHNLEKEIVEKRYTDRQAFAYFLGSAILYTLTDFLLIEEYSFRLKLLVIPVLCIAIIGLLSSFKFYISHGRTAFFKDYLALSWVIGWRVSLIIFFCISNDVFSWFQPQLSCFHTKNRVKKTPPKGRVGKSLREINYLLHSAIAALFIRI